MTKEKVEERVRARVDDIDVELGSQFISMNKLMEERAFLEHIRRANGFGVGVREETLKVLFEQYKAIYG